MKKIPFIAVVAGLMTLAAGAGYAAGGRHPDLDRAQSLVTEAIDKLEAAQRDNEDQLGGHASKAEELLKKAQPQITEALQASERRHSK